MDEAIAYDVRKPILSDDQIAAIAATLQVTDPAKIAHLGRRMQRYSDAYFDQRKRANLTGTAGEARKQARELLPSIKRARKEAARLPFAEPFVREYHALRRIRRNGHRATIEGLAAELEAWQTVCQRLIDAPPLKPGDTGRRLLRHAIGAFMALFETVASERPRHTASQGGVKGEFLGGRGGVALRMVFEIIAPEFAECTLADLVQKIDAEFADEPMHEGRFHLISAIEDAGEIEVVLRHQ